MFLVSWSTYEQEVEEIRMSKLHLTALLQVDLKWAPVCETVCYEQFVLSWKRHGCLALITSSKGSLL